MVGLVPKAHQVHASLSISPLTAFHFADVGLPPPCDAAAAAAVFIFVTAYNNHWKIA